MITIQDLIESAWEFYIGTTSIPSLDDRLLCIYLKKGGPKEWMLQLRSMTGYYYYWLRGQWMSQDDERRYYQVEGNKGYHKFPSIEAALETLNGMNLVLTNTIEKV